MLNQRVGGTLHGAAPAETAQHAAYEGGLAGAELSAKRDDHARLQRCGDARTQRFGVGRSTEMRTSHWRCTFGVGCGDL